MLTFSYACVRFVSLRKRVSKLVKDDVSCDHSRAERVGRILAALFTNVNIVYIRKRHIRARVGHSVSSLRVWSAPVSRSV